MTATDRLDADFEAVRINGPTSSWIAIRATGARRDDSGLGRWELMEEDARVIWQALNELYLGTPNMIGREAGILMPAGPGMSISHPVADELREQMRLERDRVDRFIDIWNGIETSGVGG